MTLDAGMPLPVTTDAITAQWLSRATGHAIKAAHIVDVIKGTSTKIRVAVDSDGGLPSTVIVKGGFEEHSPGMAEMYANEARFYRDIAPLLPLPVPQCWFAASDPESYQSIVIIEDLDQAGVTWLHGQKPQTTAQVADRLAVLGRFHAASWINAGETPKSPFAWLSGRFSDWSMEYVSRYLKPDVWQYYCDAPRGAAASTIFHDRNWMQAAFDDFTVIEASGPRCVIHGDTHLGNLFVWPDGTPGFLDAQPALANPFMEVAYHVTAAVDMASRKEAEQDLLRHYLATLKNHGVVPPDFEQAWLSYRQFLAYGFFIFFINETRFQTEAVNTANVARFNLAMLENDVLSLSRDQAATAGT